MGAPQAAISTDRTVEAGKRAKDQAINRAAHLVARVAYHDKSIAFGKDTAPVKSKTYRDWVNKLPCMVSGKWPVEAAHLSTASEFWGHTGRAKRNKASDRWVLPLSQEKHREQHRGNEMEFWDRYRINPHLAATILYGLFNERGDDGIERARQMILDDVFARPDFSLGADGCETIRCREG